MPATATVISPDRTVTGLYKPRDPAASHYFQCVSAHWEELEPVWEDMYQRQYGYFRPYINEVMPRFLDCGDLHNGFARLRCPDCGHEYLLAFSCKRRHFCPSCHQKRVVEFGEGYARIYSNQSLIVNGYFPSPNGCGPGFLMTENYWPGDKIGMENLARYIIRAAFSQERMRYIPASASSDGNAKIIYQSKDGRERKVFPALDWLAQLTTHIPNRREQMVRYYGFYIGRINKKNSCLNSTIELYQKCRIFMPSLMF